MQSHFISDEGHRATRARQRRKKRRTVYTRQHRRTTPLLRFEQCERRDLLSAGTLDPTFGMGGKASLSLLNPAELWFTGYNNSTWSPATAAVVQPDGKIVVAGWYRSGTFSPAPTYDFFQTEVVVARFNADGSLDSTFGKSGISQWSQVDEQALPKEMAIEPDGSFIIGGSAYSIDGKSYTGGFLLRLNTDGSVDSRFGDSGEVEWSDLGPLAIAPNGQFYTGSSTLTRFNSDGSVDTTFAAAALPDHPTWDNLLVDPQGRLLATGYSVYAPGGAGAGYGHVYVARLLVDGSLDTSFNGQGYLDDYSDKGGGRAAAIQTDGKLLIANADNQLGTSNVRRLNPDGSLDTTFGNNGFVNVASNGILNSLSIAPNGDIVTVGTQYQAADESDQDPQYIDRILPNGTLDPFFGSNGVLELIANETTPVALTNGSGAVLDANGNILTVGPDFSVTRRLAAQVPKDAVEFNQTRYQVTAGQPLTVVVLRPTPSNGTVSVDYATKDGTALAGDDYTGTSGTLTFGSGVDTQSFTVDTATAAAASADKSFKLQLSDINGGTLGAASTATVTLLSPGEFELDRGAATYTPGQVLPVTIDRTSGSDGWVTVDYTLTAGTAVDGYDFSSVSGTVSFQPGQTSQTFNLSLPTNQADHPIGGLTVDLQLSNPTSGAELGPLVKELLTFAGPSANLPVVPVSAGTLTTTVGSQKSLTLATFTDSQGGGGAGNYSATIDWNDGSSSSAGTVSGPDAAGRFTVSGSHVYADQSAAAKTVAVVIERTGALASTVTDELYVDDAPLVIVGRTVGVQTNAALSGVIATFTDPGGAQPLSDYSASVDWGDGSSVDAATITGPGTNGVFTISGSHNYATTGAPTITVTVHHDGVTPDVTVHDVAGPPSVIPTSAGTLAETEGKTFTAAVATFTDPSGAGQLASYSATINWGDGTSTSMGTISGPDANGAFTVTGIHAYAEETSLAETIGVVIGRAGSPDATVTGSADVADAPLSVTASSISGSAGAALSGALATFADPGGGEPLADYSAMIDWGDKSSLVAGNISGPDAKGAFTISGSHTYAAAGTESITITLHHDAVTPDAMIRSTASVTGPVTFNSSGGDVTVRVATGDLKVLAGTTVASSTPLDEVSSLTVNGATGTTNDFTLDYTSGTFAVPGGITFNGGTLPATPSNSLSILGGSFDVDTFDFQDAHDGSIQLGTSGQLVNYTNMTPLVNTGSAAQAVFKLPDGTVAASLDAGQTAGTVELVSGNGSFETTTFPAPKQSLRVNAGNGADTVTATNAFYSNFNTVLSVQGAANTLPLHVSGTSTITATVGAAFTDALATFIDPNGDGPVGDYSATINWGDGVTADTGSITLDGGVFTVDGTHSYTTSGTRSPTVSIEHGSAAPVTATAIINIATGIAFAASDAAYVIGSGAASVSGADGLLKNDTGPTSLSVTAGTYTGAQGGTFAINADGSFTYTPPANFAGYDSVQFTVTDSSGDTAAHTVTVLSQHAAVVWKFYESVLNRTPDSGGLQYWTNYFNNGGSTGDMAFGFFESDELLGKVLGDYYEQYLLRPLDADGLAYWKSVWHATGGPEQIKAGFADSQEFYSSAGGTPQSWLTALYQRILNRTPDSGGESFWMNYYQQQTAAGTDAGTVRYNIALGFFDSAESYGQDVAGWFQEYLFRAPTDAEKAQYVSQMQGGGTDRTIEQAITNLLEYANNPPTPARGSAAPLADYYPTSPQSQAVVAAKDALFSSM